MGVLKGALTIAVRYSAQRQQFGPPDAPEVAVLDYPSQQVRAPGGQGPHGCGRGWWLAGCRPLAAASLGVKTCGTVPAHRASRPCLPHKFAHMPWASCLQMKLMPMLATCYALYFAKNKLVEK